MKPYVKRFKASGRILLKKKDEIIKSRKVIIKMIGHVS